MSRPKFFHVTRQANVYYPHGYSIKNVTDTLCVILEGDQLKVGCAMESVLFENTPSRTRGNTIAYNRAAWTPKQRPSTSPKHGDPPRSIKHQYVIDIGKISQSPSPQAAIVGEIAQILMNNLSALRHDNNNGITIYESRGYDNYKGLPATKTLTFIGEKVWSEYQKSKIANDNDSR